MEEPKIQFGVFRKVRKTDLVSIVQLIIIILANFEFRFFLVDNGNVELIPPTPLDEEIDIDTLPITNSLLPTILYQSNTGNLNDVQLYWRRAIIGIGLNGNMVTKLYTELGAALSGIQLEDILVKKQCRFDNIRQRSNNFYNK